MKEIKEIKAYQCSFCTFYRKTKASVIKHEVNCYHNHKNRACATCNHNVIFYETIYDRNHGGNPVVLIMMFLIIGVKRNTLN